MKIFYEAMIKAQLLLQIVLIHITYGLYNNHYEKQRA